MKCIIVAKGPTAKKLKKSDYPDDYIVCINQACILVDFPDFVVMNDIDSLDGLTTNDVKHIKTFIIPEYPHINERMSPHITKDDFIERLNQLGYTGNVNTFNLHTAPLMKQSLITVSPHCVTTTHTAIYYFNKKYSIQDFETYGFLKGNGYHGQFNQIANTEQKQHIANSYNTKLNYFNNCLTKIIGTLRINVIMY
uniref:Uncharacterized protein n=1 Tax=Pyramimonas orientalis virus TaxID=455367 RepID=A0A7M3UPA7_POV01|nr:hypothetical protein HWQ62_00453 [Pyramimonas orientalis virus]